MPWITFSVALILNLVFIPLVRRASIRIGRVAQPRDDRWNSRPTPTLGGVGIYFAFLASMLLSFLVTGNWDQMRWGLLAGSSLIFLIGVFDDFKPISPQAKLTGQILASAVVIFFGYTTNFFTPRLENSLVAQIANVLITFVWLVGITNAINLLDNMDGLAGGISLITVFILSYFFWKVNNLGLLTLGLALAGSLTGFLFFNYPPASIFMGDSGSQFLGFTLAALAITRQPQASNVFAVLGVPTLLFLLPILDTILVSFTRLLRGESLVQGGRDHTSHRLIAFGLTERKTLLVLCAVALISGIMAPLLEAISYWYSLVIVPILILSMAILTAYLGGMKVVSSPTEKGKILTRIILKLTYQQRVLEVLLDFFIISLAYYLAFLLHAGLIMNSERLEVFLHTLPVALAGGYISFFIFGVYRGVWRFLGLDDLIRYLKASLGGIVILIAGLLMLHSPFINSLGFYVLYAIFLFLALAASRSSFKILDKVSGSQFQSTGERIIICGAGNSGEMALRWIQMNPQLRYQPVGLLDNDPFMIGRQIHGIDVLGDWEQIDHFLSKKDIRGVILTSNFPNDTDKRRMVIEACRKHNCWVRILRLEFELLQE